MIRVQNLVKKYFTEEVTTTALNEINLEIEAGEFVSIMGPSGCGKTTLLNVLGLLDDFNAGEYHYMGTSISTLSNRDRATLTKRDFGFVFQNFHLINNYSVFHNVELPLVYNGIEKTERKKCVEETLAFIGLDHRAKHRPHQLSGGQQQRVAVARALVKDPKVIFADEPTGNLDSSTGHVVMEMLQKLNEELKTTVIMVSHSEEFAKFGKRILQLFDGVLLADNEDNHFYT